MPDNVLRVDRNANFKTINLHAVADDSSLSAKATGILIYLTTRPDGWDFYKSDIIDRFSDGRTSIDSGLDELKEAGYLSIEPRQQEDGTLNGYKWTIREVPSGHSPEVQNPTSGSSDTGEPGDRVVSKDSNKKEHSNSNGKSPSTNGKNGRPDPVDGWMWEVFIDELGGDPPHPKLTPKRRDKMALLHEEHLADADEPKNLWRGLLTALKASDHHMSKRAYQMPESFLRNEDRRDRWIMLAHDHMPSDPDLSKFEWRDPDEVYEELSRRYKSRDR